MISLTPLETALYNWLVPAIIPRAIFAHQRTPQPAFPYASLFLMSSAREGGRDPDRITSDLTRAKSIRVTPTPVGGASYETRLSGQSFVYASANPTTTTEICRALIESINDGQAAVGASPVTGVEQTTNTDPTRFVMVATSGSPLPGSTVEVETPADLGESLEGSISIVTIFGTFSVELVSLLAPVGSGPYAGGAVYSGVLLSALPADANGVGFDTWTLSVPAVVAYDLSSPTSFAIVVDQHQSWANLDAGHEVRTTLDAQRRVVYSILFHVDEVNMVAGGAMAYAEEAQTSLSFETVVQALLQQGVAVVRTNEVHDASIMLNGQWVSRAALDVVLRTKFAPTEDTGYIAHTTTTGTIDSETHVIDAP